MGPSDGAVVLDTQCGAGSLLDGCFQIFKGSKAVIGCEKDEELWVAGFIMSQLLGNKNGTSSGR